MSNSIEQHIRHDRALLDIVADKWTMLILGVLCDNDKRARFNAIKRAIPGISQKTLAQSLRKLERNGLLKRAILDTAPVGVEYSFTSLGHTLEAPITVLLQWTDAYGDAIRAAQIAYDGAVARQTATAGGEKRLQTVRT